MKWLKRMLDKLKGNIEEPRDGETFSEWFARQGFTYFTADEFVVYFNRRKGGVKNSFPPRELWKNILPTLRIVEQARKVLGVPCVITSSYRSPDYNAKCTGAAKSSQHLEFTALDVVFIGLSPSRVFRYFLACRELGEFKGGLGEYRSFVHIDTRGRNATW